MRVTNLLRSAWLIPLLFSFPLHADTFKLAVGERDMLEITDLKGTSAAALPVPSLSQSVTVGTSLFLVSYGRDAYEQLTVIIIPNPTAPQDLHFYALGREIDSDKDAVVTLTFAKDMAAVRIDPGSTGDVEVNSRRIRSVTTCNAYSPSEDAPPVVHHHHHKTATMMSHSAPMTNAAPLAPRATPTLAPPSVP